MIKDRFVTKTLHKKTKKNHGEVSVCSIKKERKNENVLGIPTISFQYKLYSQRNLPSIFFRSQHDTFQCLTAPHSLVTGARGGEAQRADAAARHQGRSKPWANKKLWSNNGDLSEFSQYWGLSFFFPKPGVYRSCH